MRCAKRDRVARLIRRWRVERGSHGARSVSSICRPMTQASGPEIAPAPTGSGIKAGSNTSISSTP